jgi:hypothetical protein
MEDHDPVIETLRELGRRPVDPAVVTRHLSRMAGIRPRTPFSTKVKVGAAFAAGLLVGGTGLATAGALPSPVQSVAHTVFSSVGVDVPGGPPQRYNGPECGANADYKNHGQHTQDPNAGQSRCGKPIQAGTNGDTSSTDAPDTPGGPPPGHGHGNGNGHGPPAGKGNDGQSGNADDGSTPAPSGQTPVVPISPTTTSPAPTSTTTTSSSTTTTSPTTSTTLG